MELARQRVLLAASVAGILAAVGAVGFTHSAQADEGGTVHCYGINKCQGTGDCGGKGHACAGKNSCEGHGYLDLAEEDCLRISGGRLTPEPSE